MYFHIHLKVIKLVVLHLSLSSWHDYLHSFDGVGKYYLVDSGYPNCPGYLAPYKGTKYHLPEYQDGPEPEGKKEIFNYAHSSHRNVIERSFDVLKMKWQILSTMTSYATDKQTKIIIACMALHNFIRMSGILDKDFDLCDREKIMCHLKQWPISHDVGRSLLGMNQMR